MREIILDTDIGVDCDDAAALALLLELEEQHVCRMRCITTSTTREGAAEAVQAILDYYGVKKEIGKMKTPVLACDAVNAYARAMKEKYKSMGTQMDAVELLRRTLAETEEKVVLIAVGPLSNIANLLRSRGDAVSPLAGGELVEKNVECLYIMGGSFVENYASCELDEGTVMQEWNIVQDIESAQYVMEHCPCEMVLCPHEAGSRVFTRMRKGSNPVWYAMQNFAESMNNAVEPDFQRESWDPVTCLVALQDCSRYFAFSDYGTVTVESDGTTVFHGELPGKSRFLKVKGNYEELSCRINSMIRD